MFVYATVDQLEAWLQAAVPDNSPALLRIASNQVTEAIRYAFYATDAVTGEATDATVLLALQQATCAQVEFWIAAGINPVAGSVQESTRALQSKMLSASVTYDRSSAAELTTARTAGALTLCSQANTILNQAGLLYGTVTVYG